MMPTLSVYSLNTPSFPSAGLSTITAVIFAHAGIIGLLCSFGRPALPATTSAITVRMITSGPLHTHEASPAVSPIKARTTPAARPTIPRPGPVPPAKEQSSGTASSQADFPSSPGSAETAPPAVTHARFDADYLRNPPPAYPPLSRRMGEEGQVILRVLVSPDGRPEQVDVQLSSGSSRLDQAAREAVGRWQFIAARRGNEAIGAWVRVPIIFKLRD